MISSMVRSDNVEDLGELLNDEDEDFPELVDGGKDASKLLETESGELDVRASGLRMGLPCLQGRRRNLVSSTASPQEETKMWPQQTSFLVQTRGSRKPESRGSSRGVGVGHSKGIYY